MKLWLRSLCLCAFVASFLLPAPAQAQWRGADYGTNSVHYTNQFVGFTGGGRIHAVQVQNSSTSDVWLHVWDSATNKLENAGAEVTPLKIPAGLTGGHDFQTYTVPLRFGCVAGISTTDRTYTNAGNVCKFTVIFSR